jgi:dihydropyrimidinase/allantoinase
MTGYDVVIKNGHLVIPAAGVVRGEIGIKGEKIATIADSIEPNGSRVIDATGRYIFPGAVDSHFHVGIYRPMREDAVTESSAAASGGVTTIMSYFRTGKNYLNRMGSFRQIFPELLEMSSSAFLTDYAYHLAIMNNEQMAEIEWLVKECGVCTFKYYMFYKSLDLAGSSSSGSYLMVHEPLDLGFLYDLMSEIRRINGESAHWKARLSIHCENPEIIRVMYKRLGERRGTNAMKDYSDARPGWEEELAIQEVGVLAHRTDCPVNLLHLSSREAVEAARDVKGLYPEQDFMMEATLHHLALCNETDYGTLGKVNPPIRGRDDVEYLWQAVLSGAIQTVVSDHACLPSSMKTGDLWNCLPGFGGTSLMFPVLVTEGYHKRGLSLTRIAELTALNPAVCHNLYPRKGSIMIGRDADLAIVDLETEKEVSCELLQSAQDYSPFEGMRLKGWPTHTLLRGKVIFEDGRVTGIPGFGSYLKRPAD